VKIVEFQATLNKNAGRGFRTNIVITARKKGIGWLTAGIERRKIKVETLTDKFN
jgi:hypothetical protein